MSARNVWSSGNSTFPGRIACLMKISLSPENGGLARHGAAQLSVEEGIAKTLGIKLGDELTYSVGGATFSARVANLRKVNWDSFRVNFFVIASPGVLEKFPASYITSLPFA